MVIATVPLFHAMSVWAVALERQFGWSRAQLGFALTFTRIEGGLMGPVEGYLTDRVGTRRMVFIGLIILGLGFLLFGQVQNLWMFYLAYVFMAVGQGLGRAFGRAVGHPTGLTALIRCGQPAPNSLR